MGLQIPPFNFDLIGYRLLRVVPASTIDQSFYC